MLDPEFEILYPPEPEGDNWEKDEKKQSDAALALAEDWAKLDPNEVAARLMGYERDAMEAELHRPRLSPFVCHQISRLATKPAVWVKALLDAGAQGDFVRPFLDRLVDQHDEGASALLEECLDRSETRVAAASVLFEMPSPPDKLVNRLMENLTGLANVVKSCCLRSAVTNDRLRRLLVHEDQEIAAATAIGEWYAEPSKSVREDIRKEWRSVVVKYLDSDHSLNDMFIADPSLAFDWLQARIEEESDVFWRQEEIVSAAINFLSRVQRQSLLETAEGALWSGETVHELVADDLELYEELLSNHRLKSIHLYPLHGHPAGLWIEKAKLALIAGYTPEEVAQASFGSGLSWWGNESDMWNGWIKELEALASHEDLRIQEVGRIGRDYATSMRNRALQEEQEEAIHGMR